jgi:hypothetical protein
MTVGQFSYNERIGAQKVGKPFTARAKAHLLSSLRMFFRDCQEWGWLTLCFDPARSLATPLSVTSQVGPDPRVIGDDVWAKLLHAGLNLTADDLPNSNPLPRRLWKISSWYLLEMLSARWSSCGSSPACPRMRYVACASAVCDMGGKTRLAQMRGLLSRQYVCSTCP